MDYDTFKENLRNYDFARMLVLAFGLFVLSFFKSFAELRYHFGGQQTTAKVLRVKQEPDRNHRDLGQRVTFEFHNLSTGELQQGFTVVGNEEATRYHKGKRVVIEYVDDSLIGSRLVGHSNKFWVYGFVGSMTICVILVIALSLHSVLEERALRRRKWWIR